MPVRWKGLSEYKRNFKWRKSDQSKLCIPTREQTCQWAGLRSDELGISKEPNFISKRRVPYYNTQVSKSFEWNGDHDSEKAPSSELELHQPLELHVNDSKDDINQETIKTPDAPRLLEKMHSNSAGSRPESTVALAEKKKSLPKTPVDENRILASTKKDVEKIDNGQLNKVLQRKAGMNIPRSSSFPRSSEYQRQFVWKTPQKLSPVLAADQFIHSASQSIPPFKSPVIIPETEYERSFKPSPPMKELKHRYCLEERPGSEPVEISGEKNERMETFSKTTTTENLSKQSKSEIKKKHCKQKHKPLSLHRSFRKMNTEYRSNFLSPAQYMYKDGAWLRIRRNIPDQVKELREKAEAYRQRIQGTHFSRDHLNQILSDNNRLWDLSSDSSAEETMSNNVRALDLAGIHEKKLSPGPKILPQSELSEQFQQNNTGKFGLSDAATVPVKRRLVWGEPGNDQQPENQSPALGKEEEKENKQESEEIEKLGKNDKDANPDNQQEENMNSPGDMTDSSSVSSRGGGRLPTPQLRALGGTQRTHHDLTTPAAGGAVLVSPPKVKSSSLHLRKGSSEKHALTNSQVSREDLKRKSNRDEGETISLGHSSAAGLKTLDPFPLRKDQWPSRDTAGVKVPPTSVHLDKTSVVPGLKSTKDLDLPYWSPLCRIQGTLRDPEFQHNGNVASSQKSWLQLPLQERNYNHEEDDDDRLSQLSTRSAASSSLASQVLERAQRRKENFWSKM